MQSDIRNKLTPLKFLDSEYKFVALLSVELYLFLVAVYI